MSLTVGVQVPAIDRAVLSSWTRTLEKSSPKRDSINERVPASSGRPGWESV